MAKYDKRVKIDMKPVGEVIKDLGFNRTGKVQVEATRLAREFMDDFVPSDTTALRTQAVEGYDKVIYGPPGTSSNEYANIVHGGVRNGVPLNFQGAPQRGADWEVKMIADRSEQFFKAIQEFSDKQNAK